jgi:hypothetical protein
LDGEPQAGGLTCQGSLDFLVDNYVDLDATLGRSLEHVVKPVLLIRRRRPAEVNLRTQPPVQDVDALLGLFT